MRLHERLKAAREAAGFRTAKEAAKALGVPYGTYSGHESGTRGIKLVELGQYAAWFSVATSWLAFGEGSALAIDATVNVEGRIEPKDRQVTWYDDGEYRDLPLPFVCSRNTFAINSTSTMFPFLLPNQYLFFDADPTYDARSHIGNICLCKLKNETSTIAFIAIADREIEFWNNYEEKLSPATIKSVNILTCIVPVFTMDRALRSTITSAMKLDSPDLDHDQSAKGS